MNIRIIVSEKIIFFSYFIFVCPCVLCVRLIKFWNYQNIIKIRFLRAAMMQRLVECEIKFTQKLLKLAVRCLHEMYCICGFFKLNGN